MQTRNIKDVETTIRKAFEIDRMLPKVGPRSGGTLLGKYMTIPDDERSYEDIIEDMNRDRRNITREDMELWWVVMSQWLRCLHGETHEVVKKRCSGMGWKRIARHLVDAGYSDRILHRMTLWRVFKQGLTDILRNL